MLAEPLLVDGFDAPSLLDLQNSTPLATANLVNAAETCESEASFVPTDDGYWEPPCRRRDEDDDGNALPLSSDEGTFALPPSFPGSFTPTEDGFESPRVPSCAVWPPSPQHPPPTEPPATTSVGEGNPSAEGAGEPKVPAAAAHEEEHSFVRTEDGFWDHPCPQKPDLGDDARSVGGAERASRTTVVLKNIPNRYSRKLLLELLDKEGFATQYDFLYLPVDFERKASLGYAFVNLTDTETAERLMAHFQGFGDWYFVSPKICQAVWGNDDKQGLPKLVEYFRNSPLMHETVPDEFKPVILHRGDRLVFPLPQKRIRPPRGNFKFPHTADVGQSARPCRKGRQ